MKHVRFEISEKRDEIINAMLPHVAFDGWSRTCLHMAADDLGISKKEAERIFPGSSVDFITYWNDKTDREMDVALSDMDLSSMKIRERISTSVKTRLMLNVEHRDAIRKGMSVMAMPQNALHSMKSLAHTVDTMWYAAGDNATDWNYYSKRMLLVGVYSSTLLYWLNDTSDDFKASWEFLDRRIGDVMKVPKLKAKITDIASKLSGFPTLRKRAMGRFKVKSGMNV